MNAILRIVVLVVIIGFVALINQMPSERPIDDVEESELHQAMPSTKILD